jgi:TatD DNase family protein
VSRPIPPRIDGLVDSHCHLDYSPMREDIPGVLAAARAAGVVQFVHVGCSRDRLETAVDIAEAHAEVFAAIGIHPHDAITTDAEALATVERLAARPKVVAIGETGLDYHYDRSPRDVQRRSLAEHVELARRLSKPLVLHVRDAHDEARAIVRETGPRTERPGVVHCFTGTPDDARAWVELGFHLSFSGIVTFPKSDELRAAARACPPDRLLLETDAPYLSPAPVRGPGNRPAHVAFTCAYLADHLGLAAADLAARAAQATREVFGMPPA